MGLFILLNLVVIAECRITSQLPRPGRNKFGFDNLVYDQENDVAEIMLHMDLDGWNISNYNQVYDELMVHFVPSFVSSPPPAFGQYTNSKNLLANPQYDLDIFEQLLATTNRPSLKQTADYQGGPPPMSEDDKDFMMRYLQLKYSILFLQQQKFIGKYCFYGCWCLPSGVGDLGAGTGPPVDNIDKSCREYNTCYNCMYNEKLGGSCNDQKIGKYNIAGRQHANGQIFLMCVDEVGTCERQRCECDRALAEKLAQFESEWNQSHHRKWGQPVFDFEQNCKKGPPVVFGTPQSPPSFMRSDITENVEKSESYDVNEVQIFQRSGSLSSSNLQEIFSENDVLERRIPVQRTIHVFNHSPPVYGKIIGCCGRIPDVQYFREGQKCCSDGSRIDHLQQCV